MFFNSAKNATARLAEIMKTFREARICSQGIVSIQTTDQKTLDIVRRSNIKSERYNELTEIMRDQGLPLATDLMIGLPGATLESFKKDLQIYSDRDIFVSAFRTRLLPNSPMADSAYREKYQIQVDEDDNLVSTLSYSHDDLRDMLALYQLYTALENYSLLRYVLRFLQWDCGIPIMESIDRLRTTIAKTPNAFPSLTWVQENFAAQRSMPEGWGPFYREAARFAASAFGIERKAAFDTVLRLNEALMPEQGRAMPMELALQHDFVAYFSEHQDGGRGRPLETYQPSVLTIDDPDHLCGRSLEELHQFNLHQICWELRSPLIRPRSASHLVEFCQSDLAGGGQRPQASSEASQVTQL